jgi:hypothetical protein
MLQYILASEQLISREIGSLMKLQCFPAQELNLIRKEIKQFKDQQEQMLFDAQLVTEHVDGVDPTRKSEKLPSKKVSSMDGYDNLVSILQEESKLCEKKLSLLGQRREYEEEARVQMLRKLAKMKAAEENQSRDPNNFRNQGGRF